jgi:hypothetical protein
MRIDKTEIIDLILSRGDDETAERVNRELPQQVDTEREGDLLARFGVSPQALVDRLAGGEGGIGRLLGGAGRPDAG